MPLKQLELLRHAKSSWADPDIADHDRPLNARGRAAAALVGRHMHEQTPPPDLVLCSTATRTRQTLQLLELGAGAQVRFEDELYGAGAAGLLARLKAVPATVGTVLLVGHNPGIEDLTRMLDRDGLTSVPKFPTAALAVLGFDIGAWNELDPGTGHVVGFFTPRDLA
jgi:phosphohistidine phosphatase